MNDYATFFDRFREINSNFEYGVSDWSFIQFSKLREQIEDQELITYSTLLYATNLLSQIIYTYFPNLETNYSEERRSVFPKICGILSTAYSYVCPSVPSTVVIYCTQTTDDDGNANWDKKIEHKTWNENLTEFKNGVIWVQSNLDNLIPFLTSSILSEIDLTEIEFKLDEEHKRIDDEINGVVVTNRKRLTNY